MPSLLWQQPKTKFLNGVVAVVHLVPSSTKKRAVTLITADYDLGGATFKHHQLNSILVKAWEACPIVNFHCSRTHGRTVMTGNSNPIDNTNIALTAPESIPFVPFLGESIIDETITLDTLVGSLDPPVIQTL
jgi:hypothetical protein